MSETYPYTYTLKKPVLFGDETIEAVHYREPKGRDMHHISVSTNGNNAQLEMGKMIAFFAKISDQMPQFFDEISPADYIEIVNIAGDFLGGGPETS